MAGATGLSSLSGPAALVLLLPMEAGIPVPLPASCPVCVGVTLLSDRIPATAGLGDLVSAGADSSAAGTAPEGVTRA